MSTGAPFPLVFPATFRGNVAPNADETSIETQGTHTHDAERQGSPAAVSHASTRTTEVSHQ